MLYQLTKEQKAYLPVKRMLDIIICIPVCVLLAPFMLIFAVAIKLDSKGPILFKQKRVGKNKELFEIWKFRTMRTDTPKDMPTHMLNNPETFITRTGRIFRKLSIDELPQLYQCLFTKKMSLIGPRPALWNQYDLIEERDKYGANDIRPGLSGWAQIRGRDELDIKDKAKLDGEYVQKMSFLFDCRCFFSTIIVALIGKGVVEGGTGDMHKEETMGK